MAAAAELLAEDARNRQRRRVQLQRLGEGLAPEHPAGVCVCIYVCICVIPRLDSDGGAPIELPVKLRVHDSVFVPLAKWAMLMAGNYRCITPQGMRSIKDSVHTDLAASREMYEWVFSLCRNLGADAGDLVPFEKYANAANGLGSPSSAARALYGGAQNIERVDRLVQQVAAQQGQRSAVLDEIVQHANFYSPVANSMRNPIAFAIETA
jgi:hypothetical protein